jgi:tRNA nucleotidyltransferase (CCA-adding enzyme)
VIEKIKSDGTPLSLRELKITADELKALGYAGKGIGEELKNLFEKTIINPENNDRERLIKTAEKDFAKLGRG